MKMNVVQNSLRTDVTSLLLFDDYIISGMGGNLSLFSINSSELLTQIIVFQDSRVHGLCEGSDNFIVAHGGRSVSILCCNPELPKKLSINTSYLFEDWIQSVQWLQDSNIAIATAHNVVILWNWRRGEKILNVGCEEKCILYSATFVGKTWDQLVLLAGTVFREVVIWSPARQCNANKNAEVLQRLQGHKGVIFSIHYNSENGQIHTTSDDRSVKGWQVNPCNPGDWKLSNIEVLYTLYGHTARVWKSLRLKNFILSVGEDSQICVWSTKGVLVKRWSMHQGGNIWSLACSEEKKLMVTGGSDGAINVLSLDMCAKDQDPVFNLPLYEWCSESIKQCIPRRVVILKSGHLITILESGHLIFCPADKNSLVLNKENILPETDEHVDIDSASLGHKVKMLQWSVAYFNPKLASYCLLEVSHCREFVALATLHGQIFIFRDSAENCTNLPLVKIIDISVGDGKIYSFQWLLSSSFLTCETGGKLTMWSLETKPDLGHQVMKMKTFVLPFSKERWITAALVVEKFLVCGDRLGSIHLYLLETADNDSIDPCQSLPKVHGRFGVSAFLLHGDLIYSVGRDGTLRQYEISRNDRKLHLLCATRMLFDWVASVHLYFNDVLVFGFSEKKFVVWSQQQQCLVFEVPCGGGHRSWDYFVRENMLTFVYIQHRCLFCTFCELTKLYRPLLQTGFHPREVNCVQNLPAGTKFPLFISGGEDTTIRVTTVGFQKNFYTQAVLHSHISSVKSLTYCQCDDEKFVLFSAGGRAQLKVWELKIEKKSDVPAILCRELTSHMLMDCNYKQSKSWKDVPRNIDPETRYMSLCVVPHDNFFIAVGCSDGFLRLFQFYPCQQNLELVQSSDFHHRCILNVASIAHATIVTMATDGVLAFWNIESIVNRHVSLTREEKNSTQKMSLECNDFQPFSTFKIHQSGINCSAVHLLESNHILLATGGDDTALALSVFKLMNNSTSAYLVHQWRMESAHVAQITGIAFVDNYMISASVDQYIFVWKWICDISHHLLFVNKVAEYFSAVMDIHGLNVWHIKNGFSLSVHGKGFESIDVLFVNEDEKVS